MRKLIFLTFLLCAMLIASVSTVVAQGDPGGVEVTCPDGRRITNGVEVIINMRPGFTYTATALGIGGFDPVLAVMDRNTARECVDDSDGARDYTANLPTTGPISASVLNSQLQFRNPYSDFEDISIIVGGYQGQGGEFLLILEGMSVTSADGPGDPFILRISENMVASGVDSSVYMMAAGQDLDPLMQLTVGGEVVRECDDAGTSLCEGESFDLSNSYVSRTLGRRTPPRDRNAMMVMATSTLTDLDFTEDWYFSYLLTSFSQGTFGEYAVAFHVAVSGPQATSQTSPTPGAPVVAGVGRGIEVTCPDGTEITNAVEVIINMRPGFTYTATALGIDGYDPVIAVGDQTGIVLCEDDTSDAAGYSVTLPTTGTVRASALTPQQPFRHNYEGFADISIIVGGFAGQSGEFVLVLEGMAVTASDGAGDPFVVRITENMTYGPNDLAVYMMASSRGLDALVRLVDEDDEVLAECDDGGNTAVCDGTSFDLGTSSVTTIAGATPGLSTNPMLIFPTTTLTDLDWSRNYFLTFLMTSFGGSGGNYVIAFHFSTGAAPEGTAPVAPNTPAAPGGTETPPNTDL